MPRGHAVETIVTIPRSNKPNEYQHVTTVALKVVHDDVASRHASIKINNADSHSRALAAGRVSRCTLDDATETRNQFHLGHPLNFNSI